MPSFLTHRRIVLTPDLPVERRHNALRTCLTCFAPYGFRATYHHLTLSARIPSDLAADPQALVRAVEELHGARVLWLAQAERYAARRRAGKRAGRRAAPQPPTWWNASRWDSPNAAWAADPFLHPALRLPEYVRRQGALDGGAALPGCPACGDGRPPLLRSTGHGFAELCRGCARVIEPCPCGRPHQFEPAVRTAWPRIWAREHMTRAGTPNPHWPGPPEARAERLLPIDPEPRPWL